MFSLRIVTVDHYQTRPLKGFDATYSDFRGCEVKQVPVIRVFGITPRGQKACLHIHGVFPYISIPYEDDNDDAGDTLSRFSRVHKYMQQLALSIDRALNIASGNASSHSCHIHKIVLISAIPFYGYHAKKKHFLRIFFYNPLIIKTVVDLLNAGAIMNKPIQLHEAHIPFVLQFFVDYNLYGMNMINLKEIRFRRPNPAIDSNPSHIVQPLLESLSSEKSFNSSPFHVWDLQHVPNDLFIDVEKMTTCELEVDCSAETILNRLEVTGGKNPGLNAIWAEERQRLKDREDISKLTPPPSQERENVKVSESEQRFLKRLERVLSSIPSNMHNRDLKDDGIEFRSNVPCTPDKASTEDSSPVLSPCASSQSSTLLDTQDMDLVEAMVSMISKNEAELAEDADSILNTQVVKGSQEYKELEEDDDQMTLEMSQIFVEDGDCGAVVDQKEAAHEVIQDAEESCDFDFTIPQLDGMHGDLSNDQASGSDSLNAGSSNGHPYQKYAFRSYPANRSYEASPSQMPLNPDVMQSTSSQQPYSPYMSTCEVARNQQMPYSPCSTVSSSPSMCSSASGGWTTPSYPLETEKRPDTAPPASQQYPVFQSQYQDMGFSNQPVNPKVDSYYEMNPSQHHGYSQQWNGSYNTGAQMDCSTVYLESNNLSSGMASVDHHSQYVMPVHTNNASSSKPAMQSSLPSGGDCLLSSSDHFSPPPPTVWPMSNEDTYRTIHQASTSSTNSVVSKSVCLNSPVQPPQQQQYPTVSYSRPIAESQTWMRTNSYPDNGRESMSPSPYPSTNFATKPVQQHTNAAPRYSAPQSSHLYKHLQMPLPQTRRSDVPNAPLHPPPPPSISAAAAKPYESVMPSSSSSFLDNQFEPVDNYASALDVDETVTLTPLESVPIQRLHSIQSYCNTTQLKQDTGNSQDAYQDTYHIQDMDNWSGNATDLGTAYGVQPSSHVSDYSQAPGPSIQGRKMNPRTMVIQNMKRMKLSLSFRRKQMGMESSGLGEQPTRRGQKRGTGSMRGRSRKPKMPIVKKNPVPPKILYQSKIAPFHVILPQYITDAEMKKLGREKIELKPLSKAELKAYDVQLPPKQLTPVNGPSAVANDNQESALPATSNSSDGTNGMVGGSDNLKAGDASKVPKFEAGSFSMLRSRLETPIARMKVIQLDKCNEYSGQLESGLLPQHARRSKSVKGRRLSMKEANETAQKPDHASMLSNNCENGYGIKKDAEDKLVDSLANKVEDKCEDGTDHKPIRPPPCFTTIKSSLCPPLNKIKPGAYIPGSNLVKSDRADSNILNYAEMKASLGCVKDQREGSEDFRDVMWNLSYLSPPDKKNEVPSPPVCSSPTDANNISISQMRSQYKEYLKPSSWVVNWDNGLKGIIVNSKSATKALPLDDIKAQKQAANLCLPLGKEALRAVKDEKEVTDALKPALSETKGASGEPVEISEESKMPKQTENLKPDNGILSSEVPVSNPKRRTRNCSTTNLQDEETKDEFRRTTRSRSAIERKASSTSLLASMLEASSILESEMQELSDHSDAASNSSEEYPKKRARRKATKKKQVSKKKPGSAKEGKKLKSVIRDTGSKDDPVQDAAQGESEKQDASETKAPPIKLTISKPTPLQSTKSCKRGVRYISEETGLENDAAVKNSIEQNDSQSSSSSSLSSSSSSLSSSLSSSSFTQAQPSTKKSKARNKQQESQESSSVPLPNQTTDISSNLKNSQPSVCPSWSSNTRAKGENPAQNAKNPQVWRKSSFSDSFREFLGLPLEPEPIRKLSYFPSTINKNKVLLPPSLPGPGTKILCSPLSHGSPHTEYKLLSSKTVPKDATLKDRMLPHLENNVGIRPPPPMADRYKVKECASELVLKLPPCKDGDDDGDDGDDETLCRINPKHSEKTEIDTASCAPVISCEGSRPGEKLELLDADPSLPPPVLHKYYESDQEEKSAESASGDDCEADDDRQKLAEENKQAGKEPSNVASNNSSSVPENRMGTASPPEVCKNGRNTYSGKEIETASNISVSSDQQEAATKAMPNSFLNCVDVNGLSSSLEALDKDDILVQSSSENHQQGEPAAKTTPLSLDDDVQVSNSTSLQSISGSVEPGFGGSCFSSQESRSSKSEDENFRKMLQLSPLPMPAQNEMDLSVDSCRAAIKSNPSPSLSSSSFMGQLSKVRFDGSNDNHIISIQQSSSGDEDGEMRTGSVIEEPGNQRRAEADCNQNEGQSADDTSSLCDDISLSSVEQIMAAMDVDSIQSENTMRGIATSLHNMRGEKSEMYLLVDCCSVDKSKNDVSHTLNNGNKVIEEMSSDMSGSTNVKNAINSEDKNVAEAGTFTISEVKECIEDFKRKVELARDSGYASPQSQITTPDLHSLASCCSQIPVGDNGCISLDQKLGAEEETERCCVVSAPVLDKLQPPVDEAFGQCGSTLASSPKKDLSMTNIQNAVRESKQLVHAEDIQAEDGIKVFPRDYLEVMCSSKDPEPVTDKNILQKTGIETSKDVAAVLRKIIDDVIKRDEEMNQSTMLENIPARKDDGCDVSKVEGFKMDNDVGQDGDDTAAEETLTEDDVMSSSASKHNCSLTEDNDPQILSFYEYSTIQATPEQSYIPTQEEGHVAAGSGSILKYGIDPPSRKHVEETLEMCFEARASSVGKSAVIKACTLWVPSAGVSDLQHFQSASIGKSFEEWQQLIINRKFQKCNINSSFSFQEELLQKDLRQMMLGDHKMVLTPCLPPPSYKEVKDWIVSHLPSQSSQGTMRNAEDNVHNLKEEIFSPKDNAILTKPSDKALCTSESNSPSVGLSPITSNPSSPGVACSSLSPVASFQKELGPKAVIQYHSTPQNVDLLRLRGRKRFCSLSDDEGLALIQPSKRQKSESLSDSEDVAADLLSPGKLLSLSPLSADGTSPISGQRQLSLHDRVVDAFLSKDGRASPQSPLHRGITLRSRLLRNRLRNQIQPKKISWNSSSELIEGPTLKNSHDFRCTFEGMQDTKSLHEYQYLSIMSIEIHSQTREDLYPDPEHDPILAIFYCIHNDVPDVNGMCREIVGMIIVDPQSQEDAESGQTSQMEHSKDGPYDTKDEGGASTSKHSGLDNITMPVCGSLDKKKLLASIGFGNVDITVVKDEVELLKKFVDVVMRSDPDMVIGYEIEMLSWGYVLQRGACLKMNLGNLLSRVPVENAPQQTRSSDDKAFYYKAMDGEINLTGRIVLDAWRIMRSEVNLNIYTFENIYYHVLHQRLPLYKFRALTEWFRDVRCRWRVIDYYFTRVRGTLQLLEHLNMIGRTSELARVFGIQFYEVLSRGSQFRVESLLMRSIMPLNYVVASPSVRQRSLARAPECVPLILEPESRFYTHPVVVLDFQSLYPSIVIAYNYCYSTCLGRMEHLGRSETFEFGCTSLTVPYAVLKDLENDITVSPCGVAFVKPSIRRGVLPQMLEEILTTRIMVKTAMKRYKNDKGLHRLLDARQLGLKLIANVTYGYTAASFSGRMPCVEIADSIVSKGRETLEQAIQFVESSPQWRAQVIYGDTDSMFVLLPGRSKDEAFQIGKEIAEAVTAMNPKPVKLKFEKVYLPCVLETKKRYVGFMYETPDQTEPIYEAKGIETVRRDSCPAATKMLEKSLRMLFSDTDMSDTKTYIQKQFQKLLTGRASIQDCIFAKEYRGLMGYKPGACVPALEIARQMLAHDPRSEPRISERVPYVIVYGPPGLPLIRLVRRPQELLENTALRINGHYYIQNVIAPALNRVFLLIGVNVMNLFAEVPRTRTLLHPGHEPSFLHPKRSTISQYFALESCPICKEPALQGFCERCSSNPQATLVLLNNKMRKWERTLTHLRQICHSCTGTQDYDLCMSLDCPVIFRLNRASVDVSRMPHLRQLQQKLLEF